MLKEVNRALRFLLEVAMILVLGYWGASTSQSLPLRLLLGLVLPLLAMLVWGLLIAPKARRRLADPWRLLVELALFSLAALALWDRQFYLLAIVLVVLFLLNRLALSLWGQNTV
ncbi:MAG: YrdB family protein [Thermogemmatispora sp.]|uniref:YrdB family protein n=1 Tax=Thermogemmatispora sp. TaxID=1968838 RepID=UPI00261F79C9|nr:YrdB family protein [Thermogemmatispora sp.]MBX5456479.1 YrdB family protein [Thermogemmatispora sp.]